MRIQCEAQRTLRCTPRDVFELMVDPARFPRTFVGYGPIPAIRSITLDTPLAVGAVRHIHNADGTVLTEQVTALDEPTRHAYTLGGFRAPFSWLVTQGEADWSVSATAPGAHVRWVYVFTLTSVWVYPIASLLLGFFMARAMQLCLDNMARVLAPAASESAATA